MATGRCRREPAVPQRDAARFPPAAAPRCVFPPPLLKSSETAKRRLSCTNTLDASQEYLFYTALGTNSTLPVLVNPTSFAVLYCLSRSSFAGGNATEALGVLRALVGRRYRASISEDGMRELREWYRPAQYKPDAQLSLSAPPPGYKPHLSPAHPRYKPDAHLSPPPRTSRTHATPLRPVRSGCTSLSSPQVPPHRPTPQRLGRLEPFHAQRLGRRRARRPAPSQRQVPPPPPYCCPYPCPYCTLTHSLPARALEPFPRRSETAPWTSLRAAGTSSSRRCRCRRPPPHPPCCCSPRDQTLCDERRSRLLRRLLQPRLLLLSPLLRPLLQPAASPSLLQVLRDHALSSAGSGRQQGGAKGGAGRRAGPGDDGVGLYERAEPEGAATSIAVAVRPPPLPTVAPTHVPTVHSCLPAPAAHRLRSCGLSGAPLPPSRTDWTRLVPPSRTDWTRLVPHPVLTGHASVHLRSARGLGTGAR